MNEGTIKTGGMGSTRCVRCGEPVYPYGIHFCTPAPTPVSPPMTPPVKDSHG